MAAARLDAAVQAHARLVNRKAFDTYQPHPNLPFKCLTPPKFRAWRLPECQGAELVSRVPEGLCR